MEVGRKACVRFSEGLRGLRLVVLDAVVRTWWASQELKARGSMQDRWRWLSDVVFGFKEAMLAAESEAGLT